MPFALYFHFPYCLSKCPYCDFNSLPKDSISVPEHDYIQAMQAEFLFAIKQPEWCNRACSSIYFGGGTPSIMSKEGFSSLMSEVFRNHINTKDTEITIEINPGTANLLSMLSLWKDYGVNRLSLGVQSFLNSKLHYLGRLHSVEDSLNTIKNARNIGFDNISVDLIFGIPDESTNTWIEELNTACELNPQHISVYCLSVNKGSLFAKKQSMGERVTAQESKQAELFHCTQEILSKSGYIQYEVSNYSMPNYESRHNCSYWFGDDYLGIGAGAHSLCHNNRWSNNNNIKTYTEQINKTGKAIDNVETLTKEQSKLEYLLLRLRTNKGINTREYEAKFSEGFSATQLVTINELVKTNLVTNQSNTIKPTAKGFLFADSIANALL